MHKRTADLVDAAAATLRTNLLLAALPSEELDVIGQALEPYPLVRQRVLFDPEQPIEHVYFPVSGMVSLLAVTTDRSGVEAATTGRDGMVGMPVFHRTDRIAQQAVVQLPGDALRMSAPVFSHILGKCPTLQLRLHRYSLSNFMLASQSIACLSKHRIPPRLARWLLHSADQTGMERLELTHLFMAQMLGVRRSSVSVAATALRRAGLIRYSRQHVTIVDRPALERAACECYEITRSTHLRLMEDGGPSRLLTSLQTSKEGVTILNAPGK